MRRFFAVMAGLGAAAALLACGLNNGPVGGGASSSFDGTCWRLVLVTQGGSPDPIRIIWANDPDNLDCGMTLCFEAGGVLSATVSCNTCEADFAEGDDLLDVRQTACTELACTCGPPGGELPPGTWLVVDRSEDHMGLDIPTVPPGGPATTWHFDRR